MLFNSIGFAIFLPVVFILYWFVAKNNSSLQNILLLLSSYFFYSCWDYRFTFLLLFSTLLGYLAGIKIDRAVSLFAKKFWLGLNIIISLGLLAIFKYYNFFVSSFSEGLSSIGVSSSLTTLQIILPIGISFYTFHGLSYVIDIYKGKIKPEYNFVNYSLFVSYFPLLVAGPIERATHLIPQIARKREFHYSIAADGLRQILWGLFKKLVIADNCANFANVIFDHSSDYSGSTLLLGAIFFAFQIYCDFSGYSDIALGVSRLFGIELLRNFAYPYFSRDIAEFWRRWHISLSSWFRDYLYIPLGGSKGPLFMRIRNVLIIFLVSGLWHGANWTFIIWGLLNAIYIIPSIVVKSNRINLDIVAQGRLFPNLKDILAMMSTFALTVLAWIFFRAENLRHAITYISEIFSRSFFTIPNFQGSGRLTVIFMICVFFSFEWLGREDKYAIEKFGLNWNRPVRWAGYLALLMIIFYFRGDDQKFIYFQF